MYPNNPKDLRRDQRFASALPVRISVGSQLSVQGHLKDLSIKSAFIIIKNNIFLAPNDEIGVAIQCSQDTEDLIQGTARVSRIVPGEGLAVYFIKMDEASQKRMTAFCSKS